MFKRLLALTALLGLLMSARAAAGPPLICHPNDIGTAASLPWNTTAGWNGMVPSYDTHNLVSDALALLSAGSSTTQVRMETLRRAAIYTSRDPALADQLARRLFARHAWFEAGYFIEAVQEAAEAYAMIHDPAQRAVWRLRTPPPYVAAMLEGRIDPVLVNR